MSSRRYYIAIAPIDHINGKMAPQRVKCPNTEDPEHTIVSGFWYGYRRAGRQESRFAIRTQCRDLNTKPYTAAEDENRILFTLSLHAVFEHREIADDWSLMLHDFHNQTRYTTPIGFAVATCRGNLGAWPPFWSAPLRSR